MHGAWDLSISEGVNKLTRMFEGIAKEFLTRLESDLKREVKALI
jgi:hypothetical protein